MVLSMLIFGGQTLHYFALALTIGILFGIYSSVFVAAAIAMWLGVKREDLVKAASKEIDPDDPERRSGGVESKSTPLKTHPTDLHALLRQPVGIGSAGAAVRMRSGCSQGIPAVVQAVDHGAAPAGRRGRRTAHRDGAPRAAEEFQKVAVDLAARHDDAAARRAPRAASLSASLPGDLPPPANRNAKLSARRRRHDRARDPQLAARAGDDGPCLVGVHRPAGSRMNCSRGARSSTPTTSCGRTCWRARHLLVAVGEARPRGLAHAAAGAARRAGAFRRRGVPRDQSLAAAAQGAARDRPAPVHPAHA